MMPKKPYKDKTHRTSRPTLRLSDETMQEMDRQVSETGAKSRSDYITAVVHDARSRTKLISCLIKRMFGGKDD